MNTLRRLFLLGGITAVMASTAARAAEQTIATRSDPKDIQHAMDALQQLLSAYAAGDQLTLESLLEPKMIGYSRVVDAVRDAGLAQKHVQLTLSDTRTQVSDDVVIIQTRWEKRYALATARTSALKSGTCTFVMRPGSSLWRLSALSGDNPFSAD